MSIVDLFDDDLPQIPDRVYFTIGEASRLCGVKPHVLRYWEQEFEQLKPESVEAIGATIAIKISS